MAHYIDWRGQGTNPKRYRYYFVKSLEAKDIQAQPGNYMFVKETKKDFWQPVYIGQADNLKTRLPNHPELPCVKREGGTRAMGHTNSKSEQTRKNEEADLIGYWNPPCNQQHRTR